MTEVRAQLIITAKDEASGPLSKVGKGAKDLEQGLKGAIQGATGFNLSALSVVGALTAVGVGLKYAVDQAAEAERVMKQTEAVIKSTGGAAGLTAQEVSDYAGQLSRLNAIDDETIQSASNVLLTFKSIGEKVFPKAQQAAIDMSVALGTDLKGATIQIGKALEDPIQGINALRRSGVSFTQEQRNVIKTLVETGDKAKAQAIILEELNAEFGGSGAAAAQTYSGQMAQLKVNVDNLAQSLGEQLLPALTEVTGHLADFASPEYLNSVLEMYGLKTVKAADANDALAQAVKAANAQVENYGPMADEAARATARLTKNTGMSAEALGAYAERWAGLASTFETAADRQNRVSDSLSNLKTIMGGAIDKEMKDFEEGQGDLSEKIAETRAELEKYQALHGQTYTKVAETTQAQQKLTVAQYEAQTAAEKLSAAQQVLSENTDPGKQLELQAAVAKAELALGTAQGKVGEWNSALSESGGTFVTDYSTKIGDLKGTLGDLQQAYADNATAHEEATKRILFDMVMQKLGANDLKDGTSEYTEDEAALLDGLASKWGLTGELTGTAIRGIDKALGDAATSGNWDAVYGRLDDVYDRVTGRIIPAGKDMGKSFKDSMLDAEAEIDNFSGKLKGLDGVTATATVTTNYVTNYNTSGVPVNTPGGGTVAMNASGGQAFSGVPVVVGDAGRPELFVPQSNGYVFPTTAGTGGGGGMDAGAFLAAMQSLFRAQTSDLARAVRDGIQMAR